jgi:hypothetical protein
VTELENVAKALISGGVIETTMCADIWGDAGPPEYFDIVARKA